MNTPPMDHPQYDEDEDEEILDESSDPDLEHDDIDDDNNDEVDEILDYFSFSAHHTAARPPAATTPQLNVAASQTPTPLHTPTHHTSNGLHPSSPSPAAAAAAAFPFLLTKFPIFHFLASYLLARWHSSTFASLTNLGQVNDNTINWLHPIVYLRLLIYPAGATATTSVVPVSDQQQHSSSPQNRPPKASFSVLRETHLVTQRRRLVSFLIIYTLIMRYCSLDSFILLLFLSTCSLLYFMKNSRKINVQLAKKNLKQRVGWAKQWAGGLFRRQQQNIEDSQDIAQSMDTLADAGPSQRNSASTSPAIPSDKKRSKRVIAAFRGGKSTSHPHSAGFVPLGSSVGPTASATTLGSNGVLQNSAANTSKSSRRINSLFRRAASVEPTYDKANPFTLDGTVNAVPGEQQSAPPTVTPTNPVPAVVPNPPPQSTSTPPSNGTTTLPTCNSSEAEDGNLGGTKGKLSRIFSRRRVNSSAPAVGNSHTTSSSSSARISGNPNTLYTLTSLTNDEPLLSQSNSVDDSNGTGDSVHSLTVINADTRLGPASTPLMQSDSHFSTTAPTAVLTLSGVTGPIGRRHRSLPAPVAMTDSTLVTLPYHPGASLHTITPLAQSSRSFPTTAGEVVYDTSQHSSVDSVSVNASSASSKTKKNGMGHARSASDGHAVTLSTSQDSPDDDASSPEETLTRSSSHRSSQHSSGSGGSRIASAMRGKAKDLWLHVRSSTSTPGPESVVSSPAPNPVKDGPDQDVGEHLIPAADNTSTNHQQPSAPQIQIAW